MVLHPVGPLPASTYWRRRLVLLAVLLVLLVLARSCVSGGGQTPASGPGASPTPTARTTSSATPRQTPRQTPRPTPTRPTGTATCADARLQLTTESDAGEYRVGATPRFTVTVRNTGSVACRRDLGPLEVVVKSGNDRIWSSTDCAPKATTAVQRLGPGASLQTTKTWDGKRSAPGCQGTRTEAKPGTYTVRAAIGSLTSTVTVLRLTASP
jgi:hypothetical protein